MDREYFRSILKRYLQGKATAEEIKLIDSWDADMESRNGAEKKAPADPHLEERYWSAIQKKVNAEKAGKTVYWRVVGIAASLLLAAVLFSYFAINRVEPEQLVVQQSLEDGVQVISNTTQAHKEVMLPDSSEVVLEPNSHLSYTSTYNKSERAVSLVGGAFFNVARDERRPFFVHTNSVTTRVLGTSFRVEAFRENKKVIVSVKSGKVSVYGSVADGEDNVEEIEEVILTPNQKVVFDEVQHKMLRTIVESPQVIVPDAALQGMRFEEAPVSEIFAAVETVYGVDLVFDDEVFSTCTLTSVISHGDLYSRLDIICNAIGASYDLRGNQIVIAGSGCNSIRDN